MSKETKIFFCILILLLSISIANGFYSIFIKNDFSIFLTEEEIPEYSDILFNI